LILAPPLHLAAIEIRGGLEQAIDRLARADYNSYLSIHTQLTYIMHNEIELR